MLKIRMGLLEQMQRLANELHPIEACGIISAPLGQTVANRLIAMRNEACSESYFRFDTKEQLKVWRMLEQRDEECRVIYHSHTHSIPYPSSEDVQFATDPTLHYLIISTQPNMAADIRSFRIVNNTVTEEAISVVAG